MDTQKKTRPGSWRVLFRTIGRLKISWVWVVIALGLNLVLNNLLLKLPSTTADLMSGQLTGAALTKAILFYVAYGLLSFVMVAGQVQAQSYGVRRARQSIWQKMLGLRMEFFDRNDPSDLMSAITSDTESAVRNFINILIYLIPDVYYVVMALRRINEYHWVLAVSCFAMLPLKFIYALIMGRQFQTHTARLYGRIGLLTGFLADRIAHLPLIKAYTNEESEDEQGRGAAKQLLKANMRIVHLDNIATGASAVLDVLQKFIVIVVAVILMQRGQIDITMWLAFFLFAQNLFPTMDSIVDLWVRIKGVQGSFERIAEITEGQDEESGVAAFPEAGDIRFRNVTFTYPETDEPALQNVSFTVPRGSAVAIVGLCGSGKTTSVSLLERFYTPDEGHIFIGERDIRDISLSEFRRNLAYVQQGAPLPEKPVMITFDDGYYNNYLNAYPLLQKYQMKAVISIIVGETDKYSELDENKENYSHITWDMINEMMESGLIEIQNHTYNLHKTGNPRRGAAQRKDETTEQYFAAVGADLQKAQDRIEEMTGWRPDTFTYPFGSYSRHSQELLEQLGFAASLGVEGKPCCLTRDPACLIRIPRYTRTSQKTAEELLCHFWD